MKKEQLGEYLAPEIKVVSIALHREVLQTSVDNPFGYNDQETI